MVENVQVHRGHDDGVKFQGGTVNTVLVGTTVKPLADEHRVSHEELSYVVDSTASPIASLRSSGTVTTSGLSTYVITYATWTPAG